MSFTVTLSPTPPLSFPGYISSRQRFVLQSHSDQIIRSRIIPLRASGRISGGDSLLNDPRNWSRSISSEFDYNDDEVEEDDEDDEEDRSLDLLVKFVQNMFKKISRKARKALRSVLPLSISTKLVRFSVNGVLVLASLWIMKAFLEVVCTLGTAVFLSILLVRGIWSGLTYLQEIRNLKIIDLDDDPRVWTGSQPAS
ncbi:protein SHORT HYPOCOTYL IN WHITE LIGHT 1 [Tripterygium wilfordii]|nr:protein SHORT HYPOCOTYL IN WHITE LIGHT 1 [Tripterygium wilfordii]